jgi:hypothetical protein
MHVDRVMHPRYDPDTDWLQNAKGTVIHVDNCGDAEIIKAPLPPEPEPAPAPVIQTGCIDKPKPRIIQTCVEPQPIQTCVQPQPIQTCAEPEPMPVHTCCKSPEPEHTCGRQHKKPKQTCPMPPSCGAAMTRINIQGAGPVEEPDFGQYDSTLTIGDNNRFPRGSTYQDTTTSSISTCDFNTPAYTVNHQGVYTPVTHNAPALPSYAASTNATATAGNVSTVNVGI